VRKRELTEVHARAIFREFDSWLAQLGALPGIRSTDVTAAAGFLRRLDLNLRAPDALNIAIAQRLGTPLATFDERMAFASRLVGVATV